MKSLKNKLAIALLSGVIMAGSAATVFAADVSEDVPAQEPPIAEMHKLDGDYSMKKAVPHQEKFRHHKFSALEEADRLAGDFGVARADVVKYLNDGVNLKDLHHGCMIAKVSGKSLADVMAIKDGRHWPEVEQTLGITKEDLKAQMRELMAKRVAEDAHSDVKTVAKLLKDNYNPRDIEIAGIIACESGKSIQSVLNKKTVNKGWWDVAKECGVTYDQVVANHSGHNHMTFNEHKRGGHSNMSRHHGGPRK